MKKLFVYLKQYLKESILAPLFKLIEALFELFVPLIVADIIDSGIANQDKEYIISRGIFMALLGIIGFGCAVTAQYFAAKAAVSVAADMRKALYSKISKFTFTDLDKIGTATLITRMTSDTNQVQTGVNIALRLLLRSPFIVFGAMIMAFTVDVKSALIFAVTISVITLIVVFVMTVTVPLYKKNQQKLDTILLKTRESLKGVRVIRAFCKEQSEINNFNKNNDNLTASQKKVGRISSLMNPLTYVTINGAIIAIIWVGGIRVNSGELSQGQIVALYNYMSQILVELIKLANMIITINKALASVSRIDRVLSHNNHIYTPAVPCINDGYICFNNVSFKYENAADNSLYGINLTINKGEHIGIIGATGSGKSTLVNLIPKFYCCTDGSVTLNGKDIKEYSDIELRSKIGIAMQNSILFKGTFRDNLLLGDKKATDEQLLTALKNAQALDIVTAKGGLDGNILQNGRNLSGGQKQRLCIARALVGNPEILILDDSFSALDFATEANLRKAIASLPYNPTVFTVSQRVSSVMNSDKIIVMNDGFAVGIGTHEELIKCCLEYTEICRTQLKEEI